MSYLRYLYLFTHKWCPTDIVLCICLHIVVSNRYCVMSLFTHSGVQQILCYVFVLFFFVLCLRLWCQFLWIVFLRLVSSPMVPVSLDCFSSSCVFAYGASFSGLFFFVLCLRLWCQFLWIVRLDCPFCIL
jgi:hypothetical protein